MVPGIPDTEDGASPSETHHPMQLDDRDYEAAGPSCGVQISNDVGPQEHVQPDPLEQCDENTVTTYTFQHRYPTQ